MFIRYRFIVTIVGLCAGVVFVPGVGAATRYVSLDGGHDEAGGFTNWPGAATNIQLAVNISGDGDVILVSNGVYSVSSDTAVVRITNSLGIRGYFGRNATFIDGLGERRGVIIAQAASAGDPVCISGFSITNGAAAGNVGGGIYVNSIRDVQISDCIISNNTATGGGGVRKITSAGKLTMSNCWISHNTAYSSAGGGIYADAGQLELFDCRIFSNSATSGGGIHAAGIRLLVDSCHVSSNTASSQGGGLTVWSVSVDAIVNRCTFEGNQIAAGGSLGGGVFVRNFALNVFISNCIIRGNSSPYSGDAVGAGVSFQGGGGMTGCLIVSNTATAGYGAGLVLGVEFVRCDNLTIAHNHANNISGGGGMYVRANVTAEVLNSIIYGNTMTGSSQARRNINFAAGTVLTFNNCCTTPLSQLSAAAGANNFDADPLFIGGVGDEYQYWLQRNSPCINAGTNQAWMAGALDLDRRARRDHFSHVVDVGGYEYIPRGTLYGIR